MLCKNKKASIDRPTLVFLFVMFCVNNFHEGCIDFCNTPEFVFFKMHGISIQIQNTRSETHKARAALLGTWPPTSPACVLNPTNAHGLLIASVHNYPPLTEAALKLPLSESVYWFNYIKIGSFKRTWINISFSDQNTYQSWRQLRWMVIDGHQHPVHY